MLRLSNKTKNRVWLSTISRSLPSNVDVVVVGGGIVGTSTAMHIAENSNKSVVVLEQNTLTSGSTWHAAGLITTSGESEGMMKIKEYTRNVYKTFNEDNTSLVGWANTGSLMIARTPELWAQVLRAGFLLRQVKTIPYEIYHNIPPDLHPFLDMSQVLGALYLPDDGIVNPADVCLAVARRAREAGALILEHIEVTNFVRSSEGSIESVVVDREHEIECGHVVLACGQWTSQLARKHLSVHIPTAIVPHQYAIFDKISGVDNKLPVIRDYASRTYIKPEVGSFAVGTFEAPHCEMPPICKSRNDRDVPVPRDAANELYDNVPMEKQAGGLEAAMTLIPKLGEVGLKTCIHGPDTHSADHCPIVGFVGDAVPNLLVGTGFNSQGIQAGVGIGAVLSDLICDTVTIDEDFSSMDPRRFCPDISADATWCTERALEGYAETYGIHHPNVEFETGRNQVVSGLHNALKDRGAYFGALSNGWERPQFFTSINESTHDTLSYDIHKCNWLKYAKKEWYAARHGVAMFDMSSFGKLRVSGESATRVLEYCTSSVMSDLEIGDIVYTQCLNRRGGVECDVTIMKESEKSYYVVTPSLTVHRDRDHIRRVAASLKENKLSFEDLTRDYSVLAVAGPEAKLLFEDFPFSTAQDICFEDDLVARALRVSYVGEYGVEIHAKRNDATRILNILEDRARDCNKGQGLVMGGYRSIMHSLRLEKGFVHFGHDATPVDTQLESGLGFVSSSKLKTSIPFLGRDALIEQKSRGPLRRRLVNFKVHDPDTTLWGHETVFQNQNKMVGHITSGGISFLDDKNQGRAIGLGFISCHEGITKSYLRENQFHVEVVDVNSKRTRLVEITPSLSCVYDPRGKRMR